MIQTLNHRPRVQPRSEVTSTKVSKQKKQYLPQQIPQIYHPPKPMDFPESQMFYPLQTVIHQLEINHLDNVDLEFPEGQIERNIETKSAHQEEIID